MTPEETDAAIGDNSTDQLVEMLHSPDAQIRGMAATAFVKIRDRRSVYALIGLLSDEDAHVRQAAAQALGTQGAEDAVFALMDAAHNMQDDDLRANSVASLSRLASPISCNTVIAALLDPSATVRRNAAVAIGRLADERAMEPLIGLLEDDDPVVRANAAWALGQMRDPKAQDGLLRMADNETDSKAHANAFMALGGIATEESIARIVKELSNDRATPNTQIACCLALVDAALRLMDGAPEGESGRSQAQVLSKKVMQPLMGMMHDAIDNELRATAAWALGHLPWSREDAAAVSRELVGVLSDEYRWVVAYAIESLAILKDPASEPALRECAGSGNEDFSAMAQQAADIIAGKAAMPGRAPAMRFGSQSVQAASQGPQLDSGSVS